MAEQTHRTLADNSKTLSSDLEQVFQRHFGELREQVVDELGKLTTSGAAFGGGAGMAASERCWEDWRSYISSIASLDCRYGFATRALPPLPARLEPAWLPPECRRQRNSTSFPRELGRAAREAVFGGAR